MSAAKSLKCVHKRPTNRVQVHTESENYPKLHHVRFVYKHGFGSETEKMFSGFVTDLVSVCIYGLKFIVIWVIDVKLVDRQFPADQNQDDRQVESRYF